MYASLEFTVPNTIKMLVLLTDRMEVTIGFGQDEEKERLILTNIFLLGSVFD